MHNNIYIGIFVLISYLIGSIPTGFVLAKIFAGKDVRKAGSGNIGATNVTRLLGKKLGLITFAGDALKGCIPMLIGSYIFKPHLSEFNFQFVVCGFGLAAFLGHLFPIYLKFKGGKGVATALGIFIFIEPLCVPVEIALFALITFKWGYVSVASLTAAAAMPAVLLLIAWFIRPVSLPGIILSIILALLIFAKHGSNIKRLLNHTENKIRQSTP